MSLNGFDKAMLNKVKSWYSNTIYANTAITYNTVYQLMDGVDNKKIKFPLLNIYRPRGWDPAPTQTLAATRRGQLFREEDLGARYIKANLMYQIDIYTKTPEDVNNISEAIVKMFNFYPTLEVVHTDNKTKKEFVEEYEITYLSGPSDQFELDNNHRTYRYYIQYEIKNAKLYDFTDEFKITDAELEVEIEESDIT